MGFSGVEKLNLLLSLEEVSVWVHMRMSQATITGAANLYSCGRNLLQSTRHLPSDELRVSGYGANGNDMPGSK